MDGLYDRILTLEECVTVMHDLCDKERRCHKISRNNTIEEIIIQRNIIRYN